MRGKKEGWEERAEEGKERRGRGEGREGESRGSRREDGRVGESRLWLSLPEPTPCYQECKICAFASCHNGFFLH